MTGNRTSIARYATIVAAVAVAACSIPWLRSGGRTPILFGVGALACSAFLCWRTRIALCFIIGYAVVLLGLLAFNWLTGGPGMSPMEIDGVQFTGSMFLLPVVSVLAALVALTALTIAEKDALTMPST